MDLHSTHRSLITVVLLLLALVGCSVPPPPSPDPRPGRPQIDFAALETEIGKLIGAGPPSLQDLRAVVISVDGQTKIAHYRQNFTADDHAHVFSVTKSVLSILIGIAIADGIITGLDEPLSDLLPKHRQAMKGETRSVTLRHLMTMSAGFVDDPNYAWTRSTEHGENYLDVLLERRQEIEPGRAFSYSNGDAHVASAVLAAALERAGGERPLTMLDFARQKLFDPLGIPSHPSFSKPLLDLFAPQFLSAGFGWATDPDGVPMGGYGLRLTAPDMLKLGELYRSDGLWNGNRIVPADWVRESTAPSELNVEYGLFWWRSTNPDATLFRASGTGGQRIYVLPDLGAVIVYLADVHTSLHASEIDVSPIDNLIAKTFGV